MEYLRTGRNGLSSFTVEPRLNEAPRDWVHLFEGSLYRGFVISLYNLRKNNQNVRYIDVF